MIIIDCSNGKIERFGSKPFSEGLPPCSTFKIWNTLIAIELGILKSPDEAFYKWDGLERSIPAWNKDLSLREAFQSSCVPAFQDLARKIGKERMQSWIDRIGYGDKDISAGIDAFWLPAPGRKTILISPMEQALLMRKLLKGELPFSESSISVLKELMLIEKTEGGDLYGKTGSGTDARGIFTLGLFVGFVESKGKKCVFACCVSGENVMSKQARSMVESILKKDKLLK